MPPAAKGDTPLEPQPLTYRGAIWPGASRVTERSLAPGTREFPIGIISFIIKRAAKPGAP